MVWTVLHVLDERHRWRGRQQAGGGDCGDLEAALGPSACSVPGRESADLDRPKHLRSAVFPAFCVVTAVTYFC